jgi:hypothetical protein
MVLLVWVSLSAATKFTATWKAPGAASMTFAGKKVAAVVLSDDQSLRMAGEEALVRELTARGVQSVPAYRMIPREELKDAQKAKGWFERASVDGVVAMRPVSSDTVRKWEPSVWTQPYYGSFWGYWGYGWGTVYDPGRIREDHVVVVETLIFSVPADALLWAGASETTNPKDLPRFVHDVVDAAAKEMRKQGLVRQGSQ